MKYSMMSIICIGLVYGCSSNKGEKPVADSLVKKPHYQLMALEKTAVSSYLKLPAQLAAFQEVSIFPKVNGYVKIVLVDVGSKVEKGQLLMKLEAPELEQATLEAKEKMARAKADYSIEKEHYQRLLEASVTAGAISPLDISTVKSKMEADSALCNAEKNNWQMHELIEKYLDVTAPFAGVITERNVHPGALVSAEAKDGKPMLELKQIAHLRLQVDVPESNSGELKQKDTVSFYTSANPGKKMFGIINRVSMNINPQFRSERMEIDVDNRDGSLSPGMYADVILQFRGNLHAFSVPTASVITSTERKYVILIRNGITKITDINTGNQSANRIEIFGDLNPGDSVIANAEEGIKDGIRLK